MPISKHIPIHKEVEAVQWNGKNNFLKKMARK